jgi:DNA topoisomerase IB
VYKTIHIVQNIYNKKMYINKVVVTVAKEKRLEGKNRHALKRSASTNILIHKLRNITLLLRFK